MATNIYTGFFLFSLALVYFAYRQYLNTQDLLLMGKKTQATVIDLIQVSSDDGGYTYKPVFEYRAKGEKRTHVSSISSSPAPYQVGEKVQIVFDTMDDEVKIVSFWGLYRWSVILLMFAAPIFVLCGSYLLYSKAWI